MWGNRLRYGSGTSPDEAGLSPDSVDLSREERYGRGEDGDWDAPRHPEMLSRSEA